MLKSCTLSTIILFVLFLICICSSADNDNSSVVTLKNDKIYTFRNKHDSGVLTAININGPLPPVVTDKWRDAATQKWRVTSSYFSSGYQLRPTSDETKIVYFDSSKNLISQDFPGMGLSSSQFWRSRYVGHGFHQLMNLEGDECLQSMGSGKRVGVSVCVNTPKQQWQMDEI